MPESYLDGICSERLRLANDMALASSIYAAATRRMAQMVGRVSRHEYDAIKAEAARARLKAHEAREEFLIHLDKHGCRR